MTIEYKQKVPSVEEILNDIPLPANLREIKNKRDQEIAAVFTRKDNRKILIIGPCSAHNIDAVCEYTGRLASLQEKVNDQILIIPRIYTNKPRTTGVGYKGMLHQPDHQKTPDMVKGIQSIREMHIRSMRESGLSAADEMLYPGNYPYLEDLLSYVAIGARSVENQQHRLTVSGLDIPVGMKNPTSGDLKVMIDSIFAAQSSHIFIYNGWEVSTSGNPLAHAILRGAVDKYGNHIPNYHYEDLKMVAQMSTDRDIKNPAIVIDTNHSNSGKKYEQQPRIVREIVQSMKSSDTIRDMIRGFMIESYLIEGSLSSDGNEFGKSITDPCMGWSETEKLVLDLAEMLS
jgi:3-deoxy-7-phosphoheptulonate synthase